MTQIVHTTTESSAAPAEIFAVLADARRWSAWSAVDHSDLQQPAPDGDPDGVGAVRRFVTGRVTSVERVVAFEPPRRLAYELVSGLPLRDYHAEVTLEPAVAGTRITWHSTFQPKVPGTGWLYRRILQKFIAQLARDLASAPSRVDR